MTVTWSLGDRLFSSKQQVTTEAVDEPVYKFHSPTPSLFGSMPLMRWVVGAVQKPNGRSSGRE
jgi:hypothetical protein